MNTTSTDRDIPAHEPSSSPTEYDDKLPKLSHAARAYKQLSQTESFQDSVRTPKRVGLSPTFRLCGAGKFGSKLLGANFEGGQIVLVKRRLFGFVVRESGRQSW